MYKILRTKHNDRRSTATPRSTATVEIITWVKEVSKTNEYIWWKLLESLHLFT